MKNVGSLLLATFFSIPALFAQVGEKASDFTVTDIHGKTHKLYDYLEAGKYVLIDFFYTTCGPCQYYSPQVNLAYEKYGCNSGDVVFITIDFDDTNEEVEAYDKEYEIVFPSVSGKDGGGNAVVSAYGINAFPTFYLIDDTKTIVSQVSPPTLLVFDYEFSKFGIKETECATGIAVEPISEELELYPNPVTNGKLVVTTSGRQHEGKLEMLDMTGRVLLSRSFSEKTPDRLELDVSTLPRGQYLLRLRTDVGLVSRRVVLQ